MLWLYIDLDELPLLNREVALLGHNRAAFFSLWDSDYGGLGVGSLRGKVESLLVRNGVSGPIGRIMLVTLPRVLGYVFNPVSFFCCYRSDGELAALIAEVRNTVGEAHHYVLQPENPGADGGELIRFRSTKMFYVSPFLQVRGEYEVLFEDRDDSLSLEIHLRQGQQLVFSADMSALGTPLSTRSLLAVAIRLPWTVATVISRITWQAIVMYLRKKLPMYAKPEPSSESTYQSDRNGFWHRIRVKMILLASRRSAAPLAHPRIAIQKEDASCPPKL